MDLTNDDVADILALLDSLPYDSLDVQTPRFRLTLRRAPGGGWTEESRVLAAPALVPPAPGGAPDPPAPPAPPGPPETSGMSGGPAGAEAEAGGGTASRAFGPGHPGPEGGDWAAAKAGDPRETAGAAAGLAVVAAPLPGTFYRAPRPGADPFVQVGDLVSPETVVAIVETMKLMNSVHAGTSGRVSRICLENGEFTQVGTMLMLIEPAA